jgi:hypothetical protein
VTRPKVFGRVTGAAIGCLLRLRSDSRGHFVSTSFTHGIIENDDSHHYPPGKHGTRAFSNQHSAFVTTTRSARAITYPTSCLIPQAPMQNVKIIPFAPFRAFRANYRCLFRPFGPKFTTGRKWETETTDERHEMRNTKLPKPRTKGQNLNRQNRNFARLTPPVFSLLELVNIYQDPTNLDDSKKDIQANEKGISAAPSFWRSCESLCNQCIVQ